MKKGIFRTKAKNIENLDSRTYKLLLHEGYYLQEKRTWIYKSEERNWKTHRKTQWK